MSRAQWISYAQVTTQRNEAHVQNTGRTGHHVAGYINVAPRKTQWPIACKDMDGMDGGMLTLEYTINNCSQCQ